MIYDGHHRMPIEGGRAINEREATWLHARPCAPHIAKEQTAVGVQETAPQQGGTLTSFVGLWPYFCL